MEEAEGGVEITRWSSGWTIDCGDVIMFDFGH